MGFMWVPVDGFGGLLGPDPPPERVPRGQHARRRAHPAAPREDPRRQAARGRHTRPPAARRDGRRPPRRRRPHGESWQRNILLG